MANEKLQDLTPRAVALLYWHWRDLEGLLDRITPGSEAYDRVEARADELAGWLGISINYEGDEQ